MPRAGSRRPRRLSEVASVRASPRQAYAGLRCDLVPSVPRRRHVFGEDTADWDAPPSLSAGKPRPGFWGSRPGQRLVPRGAVRKAHLPCSPLHPYAAGPLVSVSHPEDVLGGVVSVTPCPVFCVPCPVISRHVVLCHTVLSRITCPSQRPPFARLSLCPESLRSRRCTVAALCRRPDSVPPAVPGTPDNLTCV